MDRCHAFPHRIKRRFPDTRILDGQALLQASLFLRIVDQRTFRRFSDCLAVFVRLRIGAECHDGYETFYIASLMFYHGHLILSQRSCLIRADHLRTAERLDSRQFPDHRIPL